MGRTKKLENYYMRIEDFAYDPVTVGGTKYVRVANVHNEKLRSLHLFSDLSLVETTMPDGMIAAYTPVLHRNRPVLELGF